MLIHFEKVQREGGCYKAIRYSFLYMGFSLGTCFSWVEYMISWSLICLSWLVLEIAERRCVVASCHIIGGFSRNLFSRDEEG